MTDAAQHTDERERTADAGSVAGDDFDAETDAEQADAEQTDAEQADAGAPPEQTDVETAPERADPEQTDAEHGDAGQSDAEQADPEQSDAEQADAERADAERADAERADAERADVETTPEQTDAAHAAAQHPDPFIVPVAMEDDPDELFPGDRGTLDSEVRRVLVHVLQRRFLSAEGNRAEWELLLAHQQIIESRMHDLYLRLVVDLNRGLAYKQQVRSDEFEVPVLLKDQPYTRIETLVLVHLRTVFQRESAAGDATPRLDIEDVEQTVLSYLTDADGSPARQQKAIRAALDRLDREGVIDEETSGRYRISPLIEVVLSAAKLAELRTWLRTQARTQPAPHSRPQIDPQSRPQIDAQPDPQHPDAATKEVAE